MSPAVPFLALQELMKSAKEFVVFERTIMRTEDVLHGMERAMSELTEMYAHSTPHLFMLQFISIIYFDFFN
jgi:hypothetical protein